MTDVVEPTPVARAPRLGWRVERRPRPGFAHVLGAAAGAFAVVAVFAFVIEATSDDPTGPGVGFNLALVVVAFALGLWAPGPVRSACVAALVLAVPLVWIFAFVGDGQGFGRGELRGIYLLTLASYLLLYLLGWTKGRAILLAGALLFFASWVTFEIAGSQSTSVVPFQSQVSSGSTSSGSLNLGGSSSPFGGSSSTFGGSNNTTDSTSTSTAALVVGLVFLAIGAVLDRRRMAGAATPFIAVGAFEAIVGAVVLGGNESVLLGGLLAIAAGAIVGLVAARGENRRATTWIGVITVFGGLVAVIVDIAPSSAAGVGGIAAGFALVLGVIAWILAPVLGEANDGDDRLSPEPAPPGGDTGTTPVEAAA